MNVFQLETGEEWTTSAQPTEFIQKKKKFVWV